MTSRLQSGHPAALVLHAIPAAVRQVRRHRNFAGTSQLHRPQGPGTHVMTFHTHPHKPCAQSCATRPGCEHKDRPDWRSPSAQVYVDDMDTAVVNMPLSLKYALKLTEGTATVGFTASTGSMWQNHDILEWRFQASFTCSPRFLCLCVCLSRWCTASWATSHASPSLRGMRVSMRALAEASLRAT